MKHGMAWTIFRKDLGRKLVALALAIIVWFAIDSNLSDKRTIPLDVEVVRLRSDAEQERSSRDGIFIVVPEHIIVRNLGRTQISVDVRGLKNDIDDMRLSAVLEVPADVLGQQDEVVHTLQLEERLFRTQHGAVTANEFRLSAGSIRLSLAERTSQIFDLNANHVQVEGVPRAGHYVDTTQCRVEPNQVELTGPRSAIAALRADPSALRLAPVDVAGQALDVVRQVGLDVSVVDTGVSLGTVGQVVSVVVPMRPEEIEVELLSVPVHYDNLGDLARHDLYRLEATTDLDLIVAGPRGVLDALTDTQLRSAITLRFDWRDVSLKIATEKVRIHTSLPDSVQVLGLDRREPEIHYRLASSDAAEPPAEAGSGEDK